MTELADQILTYIEKTEADQIRYGIFDVLLSGTDVIRAFAGNTTEEVGNVLDKLWTSGAIIRFESESTPQDWVFRSRIGETTRLISSLRQRLVRSVKDQKKHRADNSPRLVHDLKFEVAPRLVPERNVSLDEFLAVEGRDERLVRALSILRKIYPAETHRFSGFQQRSFTAILDNILLNPQRKNISGIVVTANTGAGKTLAFFLPLLVNCIARKGLSGEKGVKGICIYPRIALSENQLEDFIKLVYQVNQFIPRPNWITIGIDSSASPYSTSDFRRPNSESVQNTRGWEWDDAHDRYICPFALCPQCEHVLAVDRARPDRLYCVSCKTEHPYIFYSKDQFTKIPPDILVATTESLNSRLMNSSYGMIFGDKRFPPPSVLMLDEIHLQSSTKGSQIALLLRRIIKRLRLAADLHNPAPNLSIIGLSATIAQPKTFFSELTGLRPSSITLVEPEFETEMIPAGAERYIFVRAEQEEDTAVISTLLQTAMAVVHNQQPPSPDEQKSGVQKYKTFGFAQSLDVVGRWYYQLRDAERVNKDDIEGRADRRPEEWPIENTPLYWYRMPGHNQRLFPDFFGTNLASSHCDCHTSQHPDLNCIFFQEGECWWTAKHGLANPMQIKRKAASDRLVRIEPTDDLIVTTSALEVGYDDASIMNVIQYQAPSNIASFVQRKGRGGRRVGTRPVVTTVLSPYKNLDNFLFQNHRLLVEPYFKKLPLNPSNPFLQHIHGFYALFDWLAYRAQLQGLHLAFGDGMGKADYNALVALTSNRDVFNEFRAYLADVLDISEPGHLQELLVDPGAQSYNDNGILSQLFQTLLEELHKGIDKERKTQVQARKDILRQYLPQNLFSDVNLPELDIRYGRNVESTSTEIALGLNETIPGNVTFRGGKGSSWLLPKLGENATFILDEAYSLSEDVKHQTPVDLRDQPFPYRLSEILQLRNRLPRTITMFRPTAIRLDEFGTEDGSMWWFSTKEKPGKLFRMEDEKSIDNFVVKQVRHASSAYPLSMTVIGTPKTVGRQYAFDTRDGATLYNDLARSLFSRIEFASDTDNGRMMSVQKVIVGSQYSLKLTGADAPVDGVMTFARRDAVDELAAIGYEMKTEGITFHLSDIGSHYPSVSSEVSARLKRNFIKHIVVTKLSALPDVNFFAADKFADVMLTVTDRMTHSPGWVMEQVINACRNDTEDFRKYFETYSKRVYHLSSKNTEATKALYARSDARAIFCDAYEDIYLERELYQRYLEDTFVHTLKHGLKHAAQAVAGVDALEYVSAYTQLNMDFGETADRPIWLYEIGMGGVGVIRSVQDVLRKDPARFWSLLERSIGFCETESEDLFLLDVLLFPDSVLEEVHSQVQALKSTILSVDRQSIIRSLRTMIRRQLGIYPAQKQIRALIKLFSEDYTSRGSGLVNWRLNREINISWLNDLTGKLGRTPTRTESKGLLFAALTQSDQNALQQAREAYREVVKLLELYQKEYSGEEVRRVFENAIEHRLLLNCRDACPNCVDEGPACQIDAPGLGNLTLSRGLVREVFERIHQNRTVDCEEKDDPADLAKTVQSLFSQDLQSAVILRIESSKADRLGAVLSHLSDFGVVDRLEKRYPRVLLIRRYKGKTVMWLSLADGSLQ